RRHLRAAGETPGDQLPHAVLLPRDNGDRALTRGREAAGGGAPDGCSTRQAAEGRLPGRSSAQYAPGDMTLSRRKRRATTDAVEILHRRYIAGRPDQEAALEEARLNASIAQDIYDLRMKVGLTQKQLAALVGTSHSAISRLED